MNLTNVTTKSSSKGHTGEQKNLKYQIKKNAVSTYFGHTTNYDQRNELLTRLL